MGIIDTTFSPKTYLVWWKEIDIKNIMDKNMWQTAKERNLTETLTIEEYVSTGMDKPDPKDWETNLYHLYK